MKTRASARAKIDLPHPPSLVSILALGGIAIVAIVAGLVLQWVMEWIIAS